MTIKNVNLYILKLIQAYYLTQKILKADLFIDEPLNIGNFTLMKDRIYIISYRYRYSSPTYMEKHYHD